jgi:hypothetical protein
LLYLPFDPAIVGRRGVGLNRIGALSGMDGIISVLNRYREDSGIQEPKLTGVSKVVKFIYDGVHEAYDGRYDQTQDCYVDYRTTFFEVEELAQMAEQFQAGRHEKSG